MIKIMSDNNRGYIWLRSGMWIGWAGNAYGNQAQAVFPSLDQQACRDAFSNVVHQIDPQGKINDWVLIQGDPGRKEKYEQWSQDPADDFLANLQVHIENGNESNYYYKLIAERPHKKVDYIVGSFHVPVYLERLVSEVLPRFSRVRWTPMGYLVAQNQGIENDPVIILISSSQTVALCLESGLIKDIRVFQFSVDRCMEQLRRDHFSENQARQFLEIEFSFLKYHTQDRILSLKIETDQFLEDLKRFLLLRLRRSDQPVWIAADAWGHHDAEAAVKALTSNPVSMLSEQEWVKNGALNWSPRQERFLQVPHKKWMTRPPAVKRRKVLTLLIGVILIIATMTIYTGLRQRVSDQIDQISSMRDALLTVRAQWLKKIKTTPEGAQALTRMEQMRDQIHKIKKGVKL
jgi:hypothetical protein